MNFLMSLLFIIYPNYRTGSKSGASGKCLGCQGNGMKISMRRIGPGMIQQVQQACNECQGTGVESKSQSYFIFFAIT